MADGEKLDSASERSRSPSERQGRVGVLFLHSQSWFGADAAIHADLMRHLDRDAFDVHAACTVGDGDEVPPALAKLRQIPNVRLRPTQFLPGFGSRTALEIARNLKAAGAAGREFLALRRYVNDEGIRIIHASDRPRNAVYAILLAKLTRAKAVIHVHVKWSNEYGAFAQRLLERADATFAISAYVADTILSSGVPPERVFTILNAIDPTKWDPAIDGAPIRREFGIPSDAPLLLSVSRLFSWKGQRELLRALALVKERIPDVRLLIVGGDEPYIGGGSYIEELKTLASTLGVAERVVFTGLRSDIPQIMAACDVFSMPSFEEPFGLVFLEAMSMKRPVAAVNNGGTPEVVEQGLSGLLSPAWDVESLAENLVTLLGDRELRARMGEHGRARVLDFFNAKRMAEDAARAYHALIARRDGAP